LAREENSDEGSEEEVIDAIAIEGDAGAMDVNMVFMILAMFRAHVVGVAEMTIGVERAVFKRPKKVGQHKKPLYVKGACGWQAGRAHDVGWRCYCQHHAGYHVPQT
jgi:hypothetical protein